MSRGIPYVLYYQKIKGDFTLYFKYDEKGGYLETNGNEILINVINNIFSKYTYPKKENNFYLKKENQDDKLDPNKTLIQNGLKSEDTIIIS